MMSAITKISLFINIILIGVIMQLTYGFEFITIDNILKAIGIISILIVFAVTIVLAVTIVRYTQSLEWAERR